VEMAEQSLHSSMKMSKNEVGEQQDIQHKGKVFHDLEKEAESISQVHYSLEKAQKENLIKDFQGPHLLLQATNTTLYHLRYLNNSQQGIHMLQTYINSSLHQGYHHILDEHDLYIFTGLS
jgi:hypothetical protein